MDIKTDHQDRYTHVSIAKPGSQIVTAHFTVDLYEDGTVKDQAGLGLYTDLLLSGAGPYTRNEFLDKINGLGASIGIKIDNSRLTITIETLAPKLPKVLSLVTFMLREPRFAPAEIKRAKMAAHNNLEIYKENARGMAEDAFLRELLPTAHRAYIYHPSQVQAVLSLATRAQLIAIHERMRSRFYVLTVGGAPASIKKVQATIAKAMHKDRKVVMNKAPLPQPQHSSLTALEISSSQNIELSIGNVVPLTIDHDDFPAFFFGLAVLGKWGGFAGRLMSTVREKEGLTYGIYARLENMTDYEPGNWRIMTFFSAKDAVKGLTSTRREITKICKEGITANELKHFKQILHTGHVLVRDSLVQFTRTLHLEHVRGVDYERYKRLQEQIESLTRSQVNKALRTYMEPKQLVISAAGPVTAVLREIKKAVR